MSYRKERTLTPVVFAVVMALLTVAAAFRKSVILTAIGSALTAGALFTAYPTLLSPKTLSIGPAGNWIVCLLGVIIVLLAGMNKKVHTAFILAGMIVAMWALFRNIPNLQPAFAHLGPNLQSTWNALWHAAATFWRDMTGSN